MALFIAAVGLLLCREAAQADSVISDCSAVALQSALLQGGVITFTNDCSITLSGTIGIHTDAILDAQGHKVTISGGGTAPLFVVHRPAHFTGVGLTLTGGMSPTRGGAVLVESYASLVMTNCTLAGNKVVGADGVAGAAALTNLFGDGSNGGNATAGLSGSGGAIYNLGYTLLANCALATNSASGGNGGSGGAGGTGTGTLSTGGNGGAGGAGGAALGGAIYNANTLVLINCSLTGNTLTGGNGGAGGAAGTGVFPSLAGGGGSGGSVGGAGVYNAAAGTFLACTFSGNTAQGGSSAKGGEQVNGTGSTGFPGGDASGGGLSSAYLGWVTNCTFYNNQVAGGNGGNGGDGTGTLPEAGDGGDGGDGIGGAVQNSGTLFVVSCTVANNGAVGGTNGLAGAGVFRGSPGHPGGALGGGLAGTSGTLNLANTLLSTNLPGANGYGAIVPRGYNLSSDSTPALSASQLNRNPLLGPLANNGGPTLTMKLLSRVSPALDVIPVATPPLFPPTDQRGVPRPVNGRADIGAYEFEAAGAPVFVSGPVDVTVPVSSNVTFTASAVGATPLQYQWLLNGEPIASATRTSLTITNASSTNAGPYSLRVANSVDTVESGGAFIHFVPTIFSQPAPATVAPGDTAVFAVTAGGDPVATTSYQWQFNGADLPGATSDHLTVANAHQANVGSYQVLLANDYGSVTSAPAALNLKPAVLSVQPTNLVVSAGSTVTLTVNAEGSPPLSYQWRQAGQAIAGATASAYAFKASSSGVYDVVVTNRFGSATSGAVTLTVPQAPAILSQPLTLSVSPGQSAQFTVSATGDSLAYQWAFQGQPIPGATTSSYTVVSAQPTNAGSYVITITNALGSASQTNTLVLLPQGLVLYPAPVTSNVFSFSFQAETNLSYEVQYRSGLGATNWSTGAVYSNRDGVVQYQEPVTNAAGKFYRILGR